MSDIIQVAQDLQSEFNNERQDWLRERGGESIEMPLDCTVLYGDEEARDVIGALAEETWEYAVQFKNEETGKWYTNGFYGRGMHGQKWFGSREEAEQQVERSYPAELVEPKEYRIVRRRVSPVEECE